MGIGVHVEGRGDALQSGPDVVTQPEEAGQVDPGFEVDLEPVEVHTTCRGLGRVRPGDARTERGDHDLDRSRPRVLAEQLRRVVAARRERARHLLPELRDAPGPDIETEAGVPRDLALPREQPRCGLRGDSLDGGLHLVRVPTVENDRFDRGAHCSLLGFAADAREDAGAR